MASLSHLRISCPACGQQSESDLQHFLHVKQNHQSNGLYLCTLCPTANITMTLWEQHIDLHNVSNRTSSLPYWICPACDHREENNLKGIVHINQDHKFGNLLRCHKCPAAFQHFNEWHQHVIALHSLAEAFPSLEVSVFERVQPVFLASSRTFYCGLCWRSTCSAYALVDHLAKAHATYFCQACEYQPKNLQDHDRHVYQMHMKQGGKEYLCPGCPNKPLVTFNSWAMHIMEHLNAYGYLFDGYRKVVPKQQEIQSLRCSECFLVLENNGALRQHQKVHSWKKCLFCDFKAATKYDRNSHVETTHKIGDFYVCPQDNFASMNLKLVNWHFVRCH